MDCYECKERFPVFYKIIKGKFTKIKDFLYRKRLTLNKIFDIQRQFR